MLDKLKISLSNKMHSKVSGFGVIMLQTSLILGAVGALSVANAQDAQKRLDAVTKTINVKPVKAVPPEPTYFPDEAHELNKIHPASGGPTDEAMIGSIALQPNPAYPRVDQNTLQRLRGLNAKVSGKDHALSDSMSTDNLEVMPESPILSPKAAWLVGPSQASRLSAGDAFGCIALNQFSNDFIVGIHASNGEIMGLTVDTRQSVFKPDEVYPIAMSLGNDSYALMGLGSTQSTIAISLEEIPTFGYKASNVGVIRMVIGSSPMYLSTTGLRDGLARLQKCMEDKGAQTLKVANSTSGKAVVQGIQANATGDILDDGLPENIVPMAITNPGKNVPIALAITELIPSGHRFVIEGGVDPMMRISWEAGPVWFEVLSNAISAHGLYARLKDQVIIVTQTPPSAGEQVPMRKSASSMPAERVWEASQGESLEAIIYEWAQAAGVRTVVDLDTNYKLEQDFFYDGRFEDAVSLLMGRFESAEGGVAPRSVLRRERRPMPRFHSASLGAPSGLSRYSDMMGKPMPQLEELGHLPGIYYNATPTQASTSARTWQALEGASLKDILRRWSRDSGVELVWNMDQMIELKESVKLQGSFTDAVAGVLQQYSTDEFRPVAQLNKDPETRQQILIIRLAKVKSSGSENRDDMNDGGFIKPKSKPSGFRN